MYNTVTGDLYQTFPSLISGGLIEAPFPASGLERIEALFPSLISGGLIEARSRSPAWCSARSFPSLISGGLIEARRGRHTRPRRARRFRR